MVTIYVKWPKTNIIYLYCVFFYWILHMKFEFKQPSDFWETYVAVQIWVALDDRSKVSLTFGAYIKPVSR